MKSQPRNPEFKNNPENFHLCNTVLYESNLFPLAKVDPCPDFFFEKLKQHHNFC